MCKCVLLVPKVKAAFIHFNRYVGPVLGTEDRDEQSR